MQSDVTYNVFLKRIIDYTLSLALFLLFLPLIFLIGIAVKITNPGPIFFIQERVGLQGKIIKFVKFRTMYVDAEERLKLYLATNPDKKAEWEKYFSLDKDPRVIPFIGNFLRKTSLDELPNLINVLRGDISLVGPRPLPLYHFKELSPEIQQLRQSVLPGITGLWQITRGDINNLMALDSYYIKNWSLSLDLRIILNTIFVVLLADKPNH
jgi:lipopolysaccharide/colanic/teichoic acid biosynthesis glycosyltransferase